MSDPIEETESLLILAILLVIVGVAVWGGSKLGGALKSIGDFFKSLSNIFSGWGPNAKKPDGSPATIAGGEDPQTYALDLSEIDLGTIPLAKYQFRPQDAADAYSLATTEGMDLMTQDYPLQLPSGS